MTTLDEARQTLKELRLYSALDDWDKQAVNIAIKGLEELEILREMVQNLKKINDNNRIIIQLQRQAIQILEDELEEKK